MSRPLTDCLRIPDATGGKFGGQQRLDAVIGLASGTCTLVAAESDDGITATGDSGTITVTGPTGASKLFVDSCTVIAADGAHFFAQVLSKVASTGVIVIETSTTYGTAATATGQIHLSWRLKGVQ